MIVNTIRRACVFILTVFLTAGVLGALDWPTDKRTVPLTFGSEVNGGFFNGLIIESIDGLARSVAEGDVFFVLDDNHLDNGMPSGLGGFLAVEGKDGLVSVYAGLEKGGISSYLKSVHTGDILGKLEKPELSFFLFDRMKRRFVNPFIFMQPPSDSKQPSVRSVSLVAAKQEYKLGEVRTVRQGTYELIADVIDPVEKGQSDFSSRAPFRVSVFVDGVQRLDYVYETAKAENGSFGYFNIGVLTKDFYKPDGRISLGSYLLNRGKASILIIAKDFAGNERQAGFTLNVE
jgi:hypothetical protein